MASPGDLFLALENRETGKDMGQEGLAVEG